MGITANDFSYKKPKIKKFRTLEKVIDNFIKRYKSKLRTSSYVDVCFFFFFNIISLFIISKIMKLGHPCTLVIIRLITTKCKVDLNALVPSKITEKTFTS